jgi:hypothetical protein
VEMLRNKLTSLRADQLLSANVSGSFDGVLEVINRHETLSHTIANFGDSKDQSKAVGETIQDLVYTPITPCRFLDTRGVFSPVFSGGAFAANETRTYQASGNCGIPAGAQAAVTQIIMITPSSAGDIELLPQGAIFGNTVAMVFQAGVFSSVSQVTKLNAANGQFSAQIRGPGGNVAIDVTGYFMPPNRVGKGISYSSASGAASNSNGGFLADTGTDARATTYVLRGRTIGAVQADLTLNGSGQLLNFEPTRTAVVNVQIVGKVEGQTQMVGATYDCLMHTDAANNPGFFGCTSADTQFNSTGVASPISLLSSIAGNYRIVVTGAAGKNIRWVAAVRATEVRD